MKFTLIVVSGFSVFAFCFCFELQYEKIKIRLHGLILPDDNNDAVEYIVRVPDVSKQAEGQQHEAHLQDKHAGENDVTDL